MTRIIIQVKDYESGEVTSYKLMSTTKLGKMFNAHTQRRGIGALQFFHGDERIVETVTPEMLLLENEGQMTCVKFLFRPLSQLSNEVVGCMLKDGTIDYFKALDSLKLSHKCLHTSADAREFVDKWMVHIVILLLKQESHSIGAAVKECIHCTLEYSLRILCDDLKMSTEKGNVCTSLNALQHIFDRRVPITAATEWIWFG